MLVGLVTRSAVVVNMSGYSWLVGEAESMASKDFLRSAIWSWALKKSVSALVVNSVSVSFLARLAILVLKSALSPFALAVSFRTAAILAARSVLPSTWASVSPSAPALALASRTAMARTSSSGTVSSMS